jgi:hypothetical protein
MPHNIIQTNPEKSVIAKLRSVVPKRRLSIDEALRIAELQANHLLALGDVDAEPVPEQIISELPNIHVEYVTTPLAGTCFWDGHKWVVQINQKDTWVRQRFVLAHEYKHILDYGYTEWLYPSAPCTHELDHSEYAADYFAGCLLVPRVALKRAFAQGIQRPQQLAQHFGVSERTVETRLHQVGLVDPTPRCIDHHRMRNRSSALLRRGHRKVINNG